MADVKIDTTARIERVRLENQASSPASPAAGYSQIYAMTTGSMRGLYIEYAGGQYDPLISPYPFEGRLTLKSGVPEGDPTGTSAAGDLYYTPYVGNRLTLLDANGSPEIHTFNEISLSLSTTGTASYDAFVYDNAGTLTLEIVGWTSPTSRATSIVRENGILVKSGAITRSYLGTFYSETTNEIENTEIKRFLYNYYHKIKKPLRKSNTTNHFYPTGAWRYWNNDTSQKVEYVIGVIESDVEISVGARLNANVAGRTVRVSIGKNSSSGDTLLYILNTDTTSIYMGATWRYLPTLGYSYISVLEWGTGANDTFDRYSLRGNIKV